MEDLYLLDFCTTEAVGNSEFSDSDAEAEIEAMFTRNKYIQQYYERLKLGTVNNGFIEEFCDALAQYDVDPYHYFDDMLINVRTLLDSKELYLI